MSPFIPLRPPVPWRTAFLLGLALAGPSAHAAPQARPVSMSIGTFSGAWNPDTRYRAGQIVTHDGSSYISLRNRNRNRPPAASPADWGILAMAGPPGPPGPPGQDGRDGKDGRDGARGAPGASFNPLRIAMKHWHGASQSGIAHPVGDGPVAGAFDGSFLWIANQDGATLTKLRPSDGAILDSHSLNGAKPSDILFDGNSLWLATTTGLVQVAVADGTLVRTVPIPAAAVSFDGEYVWTAAKEGVYKVKAADGTVAGGPYQAGAEPTGIAFDGQTVWVGSAPDSTFTQLDRTGKELTAIHWLNGKLGAVVFDGSAMWVLKSDEQGLATKILIADATTQGNYPAGRRPTGIVFDGTHIWVASPEDHTVTRLNGSDGSVAARYRLDDATFPTALVFDGANVWVLSRNSDSAIKL